MTEPAGHQPDPTPCLAEEDRDGAGYICTRPSHRGGAHKMIKLADAPAWLTAARSTQTVARLEDTDDPAELLPADPPPAALRTMHELAELVGLAEIDRRFDLLSYQTKAVIAIAQDLRVAKVTLADDRPVDPEVMERIKKRVDAWLLQRDLTGDGGS